MEKEKELVAKVDDVKELLDTFVSEKMDKKFQEIEEKAIKKFNIGGDEEVVKEAKQLSETAQWIKALGQHDSAFLKDFSRRREKLLQIEGTDALGGYLVPEEFEKGVMAKAYDYNQIRQDAMVINMRTDTLNLNELLTEPSVSIVGEATAQTTTTSLTFGAPVLTPRKYIALAGWSSEFAEDNDEVDFINLINERFGIAIANAEQTQFISGTVSGSEGLLQVSGVTGITLNSGTGFTNITWDDLSDMQSSLQNISVVEDVNAKFYMHPTVWNTLKEAKASTAGTYFVGNPQLGVAPQAWGRPVVLCNSMPSSTATATKFVMYGNLKKVAYIGDRRGMAVKIFDSGTVDSGGTSYNLVETDSEAIRVTKRTGFTTALEALLVTLATN